MTQLYMNMRHLRKGCAVRKIVTLLNETGRKMAVVINLDESIIHLDAGIPFIKIHVLESRK